MAHADPRSVQPPEPPIDWLIDSDPSIRWQVMQDLQHAPAAAVAAERARVASTGWGSRLLALQDADGNWGGGPWVFQSWMSTMETLMVLRDLGVDPTHPGVQRAIALVREKSEWGPYHGHAPFFEGESEPCINGRVLACGAYFGVASDRLAERLLGEQLSDGGWNCNAPESSRASFNTTICVLEGLFEYERAVGARAAVTEARLRGQEYLTERGMFKSRTTGRPIERDRKNHGDFRKFAFPTRWHYDVLWGLDYLRRAGVVPDKRLADAVELVTGKRGRSGRWSLDVVHDGTVHFALEGGAGSESRWITLRALRVLEWWATAR